MPAEDSLSIRGPRSYQVLAIWKMNVLGRWLGLAIPSSPRAHRCSDSSSLSSASQSTPQMVLFPEELQTVVSAMPLALQPFRSPLWSLCWGTWQVPSRWPSEQFSPAQPAFDLWFLSLLGYQATLFFLTPISNPMVLQASKKPHLAELVPLKARPGSLE